MTGERTIEAMLSFLHSRIRVKRNPAIEFIFRHNIEDVTPGVLDSGITRNAARVE